MCVNSKSWKLQSFCGADDHGKVDTELGYMRTDSNAIKQVEHTSYK